MAVKLTNTSDVIENNGIKCLIYGQSGVGKTTLASTIDNVLIIGSEKGELSLADFDIPMYRINTFEDLGEVTQILQKGVDFDAVFIDSISDLLDILFCRLQETIKDGRQVYSEFGLRASRMVRFFRDLPEKNVIFTALEIPGDGENFFLTHPMTPWKQYTPKLPSFFDEVFRMSNDLNRETKEKTFKLQTSGCNKFVGKDRSGKLDMFEAADLNSIFNKIKGN